MGSITRLLMAQILSHSWYVTFLLAPWLRQWGWEGGLGPDVRRQMMAQLQLMARISSHSWQVPHSCWHHGWL